MWQKEGRLRTKLCSHFVSLYSRMVKGHCLSRCERCNGFRSTEH